MKNFMQIALETAKKSGKDLPVGAIIVKNNEIIACAHNEQEKLNDITAHAEILAIREAEKKLKNWRLNGCTIYVTLEPCPMCAWAILRSRIDNLVFGAYDTLYGAFSTLPELTKMSNSTLKVKGGIMEAECREILEKYFKDLR